MYCNLLTRLLNKSVNWDFASAQLCRVGTYRTRDWALGIRHILVMNFSCVLLQIKIATKSLLTNMTSIRLVIVVSVHVESKIVYLTHRSELELCLANTKENQKKGKTDFSTKFKFHILTLFRAK